MKFAQITIVLIIIALYIKWFYYVHDCMRPNANEALLIVACLSILFSISMCLLGLAGALSTIF
jgi:hypothetical protein